MQINKTGIGLVALFFVGGVGFLVLGFYVELDFTLLFIGFVWSAVGLGLGVLGIIFYRRSGHERGLFSDGLRGRGTIVSVKTVALINAQPLLEFVLDVEVAGLEPKRVKHTASVSSFAAGRLTPGFVLPVCVNPADHDDLLLVW